MIDTDLSSVLAVCVAYNSFAVLPTMAASLPKGVRLVVVDNGPEDGARNWVKASGHVLITPEANIGFGPACNLGAAEGDSEFILFLNPDAQLEAGALQALISAALAHPEAVAFGPELQRPDGSVFRYRASTLLGQRNARNYPARPTKICQVPSLNGACFLCRRDAFERVGGFDTNIFLYFEDDDLSLRLSEQEGPLLYVPEAKVVHVSGGSTPADLGLARLKGYHYSRSLAYVLFKRNARFPRLRALSSVLRRLFSIRMIKSASYRSYAFGRWIGVLGVFQRSYGSKVDKL